MRNRFTYSNGTLFAEQHAALLLFFFFFISLSLLSKKEKQILETAVFMFQLFFYFDVKNSLRVFRGSCSFARAKKRRARVVFRKINKSKKIGFITKASLENALKFLSNCLGKRDENEVWRNVQSV